MIDDAKNALEELRETYAWGATACGCCTEDRDEDRDEFDRLLAIVLADNQTKETHQ